MKHIMFSRLLYRSFGLLITFTPKYFIVLFIVVKENVSHFHSVCLLQKREAISFTYLVSGYLVNSIVYNLGLMGFLDVQSYLLGPLKNSTQFGNIK